MGFKDEGALMKSQIDEGVQMTFTLRNSKENANWIGALN